MKPRRLMVSRHWLARLLAPHGFLWGCFGALVLVEALARLAVPLYYKLIFDRVLVARDQHLLLVLLGGILAVLAILTVAELAQSALGANLGLTTINDLRAALFARVQSLPVEYVGGVSSGELVGRFTTDIGAVGRLVTTSIYKVGVNGLIALCSAVALFVVEWRLALFAVAVFAAAAVLPKVFGALSVRADRERRRDDGAVAAEVSEALAAHRVIRAYSLGPDMAERFAGMLGAAFLSGRRSVQITSNLDKSVGLALLFGQILIVALGAYLVTEGLLTAGSLIGFVGLLVNVSTAIASLTIFVPDFIQGAGAAARIGEIVDLPPGPADDEGDPQPLPGRAGDRRSPTCRSSTATRSRSTTSR